MKYATNHHMWDVKRKTLAAWAVLVLITIAGNPLASASTVSDLFGTWDGTWQVDEKHSGLSPLSPPFSPATVQFNIGPFNPVAGNYGTVFVESALSGVISSVTVTDNNVTLLIDYPLASFQTSGTVTGVLTGNMILGDFDEVPAAGWITWKGPIEISKTVVPLPAAIWFLATGLAGLIGLAKRGIKTP